MTTSNDHNFDHLLDELSVAVPGDQAHEAEHYWWAEHHRFYEALKSIGIDYQQPSVDQECATLRERDRGYWSPFTSLTEEQIDLFGALIHERINAEIHRVVRAFRGGKAL